MKSNKAKEYIKNKRCEDYPGGHLCYRLSEENAIKAVEIAEEEMEENAIESFCKTICGGQNNDCKSCTLIKTFKNELE